MTHSLDTDLVKKVEEMVDNNYHTEAMIEIADWFLNETTDDSLREDLVLFKTLFADMIDYHNFKGYFNFGKLRDEVFETMLDRAEREFGSEIINTLRSI